MNLHRKYRQKSGLAYRRIAEEPFLVPVCAKPADMQKIFVLNPLADFIWKNLDGVQTLATIRDRIVDDFEVDKEQAGADMESFVSQLLAEGLLEGVA